MTIWREEILHSAWRARFEVSNLVYEEKSEFQDIVVFDNENYDRILMIDNIVQLSTRDEFIYHEMMSHVALFSVENPASVLIIGGGDGGIMREALRHKSVTDVTLCELDETVINISKKYLPTVAGGAFEDPRAKVEIMGRCKVHGRNGEEIRCHSCRFDRSDRARRGSVQRGLLRQLREMPEAWRRARYPARRPNLSRATSCATA